MNAQSDDDHNMLGAKIGRLLNQGVNDLNADIATKLLNARKEALGHYKDQPAFGWVPVWAGSAAARVTEPYRFNFRVAALTVAFIAVFACALAWQSFSQSGNELVEVDAGLLTDDLPINAYLDRGFDSWLKRHAP
jgi:hypothetical protein